MIVFITACKTFPGLGMDV